MSKKFNIKLILIFLIANFLLILLRLPDFYRPLWNDEIITLQTTLINPLENPLYNEVSTNLPLYYYITKIGSYIFTGENLRVTSLIFSILILNLLLYRYKKEEDFSYILASLFIIFSPIQIYYAAELRTYMLTQFLLILQFFWLKDYLENKRVNFLIWGIIVFLSLISHYTAYLFVLSSGVYLLFKEKKISENLLKSYIIPSVGAVLILILISGNARFTDSTENSILNLNFSRFSLFNIQENILRTVEVATIYYNFGLHYYRLDPLFTSLFKKFMYFFLGFLTIFLFYKNRFKDLKVNMSFFLLVSTIFFAILVDLGGFIIFAGRYIFPFHFLYILVISYFLNDLKRLNRYLFITLLLIVLASYNLYNYCLFKQIQTYIGNEDPQGVIVQNCFK